MKLVMSSQTLDGAAGETHSRLIFIRDFLRLLEQTKLFGPMLEMALEDTAYLLENCDTADAPFSDMSGA